MNLRKTYLTIQYYFMHFNRIQILTSIQLYIQHSIYVLNNYFITKKKEAPGCLFGIARQLKHMLRSPTKGVALLQKLYLAVKIKAI